MATKRSQSKARKRRSDAQRNRERVLEVAKRAFSQSGVNASRSVDHDLPLSFARLAHQAGTQNFALVSAIGASVDSSFFYARVKGELERDVREIGFTSLTILRPGIIEGERDEVRLAESLVLKLSHFLAPVLPKRFRVNPAPKISQALVDAVVTEEPGCHLIHLVYSDSLV